MHCLRCAQSSAEAGALCEACAARLCGRTPLCPEQITSQGGRDGDAALLDQWGRAHPIGRRSVVGRQADSEISIAEPSVSRRHAEIERLGAGWFVRDLDSSNGTSVNGAAVAGRATMSAGDVVTFGDVSFFFLPTMPSLVPTVEDRATQRPAPQLHHAEEEDDEEGNETFAGLSTASLQIIAPTGGGGGVLQVKGRAVQLTFSQFELMRILATRMFDEPTRDPRVRGFVRSSELAGLLPWDTARPDDNNIKQLVRRLRRALGRAGIDDIVESRHGFGYRLRLIPAERPS